MGANIVVMFVLTRLGEAVAFRATVFGTRSSPKCGGVARNIELSSGLIPWARKSSGKYFMPPLIRYIVWVRDVSQAAGKL